ncbi:hypothetical protein C2S52_013195 [Perilla frutescens var. hirtella]|nr:hypothetical protein C2S51_015524 [Perilla frutescens var. frutescens]KAH6775634.1 hypothetical protein C2S52_013195 [Perilla frutescens var. hirtella]
MKRRREVEVVASDIRSAIEEASLLAVNLKTGVATADVVPIPIPPIQTNKIGPTMALMRQDIHQNIPDMANNGWDVFKFFRDSGWNYSSGCCHRVDEADDVPGGGSLSVAMASENVCLAGEEGRSRLEICRAAAVLFFLMF